MSMIAKELSKHGIEIRKIESKEKLPKTLFFQMMVGGYRAMVNHKAKLLDYDKDISNYDEIIIGSPIWFDRLAAPTNRILSDLDLNNKKISFILYSGSGIANKATEKLNKMFNKVNIIYLKEPKKYKEELDKLKVYE